ncbi:hypothetical protein SFSGTM_13020 [Sulfuriferula nivalis]|uniref:Uncharacterized protein n=1 Tax=Sulfuriferula nivalis TaxID=2675298 RepID=A0A809RIC4_9PROT|nr:hypothetical protein SFSGTM_13020 [Sulfuriferula nivalis]
MLLYVNAKQLGTGHILESEDSMAYSSEMESLIDLLVDIAIADINNQNSGADTCNEQQYTQDTQMKSSELLQSMIKSEEQGNTQ